MVGKCPQQNGRESLGRLPKNDQKIEDCYVRYHSYNFQCLPSSPRGIMINDNFIWDNNFTSVLAKIHSYNDSDASVKELPQTLLVPSEEIESVFYAINIFNTIYFFKPTNFNCTQRKCLLLIPHFFLVLFTMFLVYHDLKQ